MPVSHNIAKPILRHNHAKPSATLWIMPPAQMQQSKQGSTSIGRGGGEKDIRLGNWCQSTL